MNDKTRKVFEAAGIDPTELTAVPGTAIHAYMVGADGWLDWQGLLMFVGQAPKDVAQFMYYIGEEQSRNAVGTGKGIVAYAIGQEREEWIRARLPEAVSQ